MGEFMMMGLRLTQEGVSNSRFQTRFGSNLLDIFKPQIEKLVHAGLIEWTLPDSGMQGGNASQSGQAIRLTRRGRLLGNRVFSEFLRMENSAGVDRSLTA